MNWTMPYPWRSRRDSVRRINMSSEPGNESFVCALRPIPRILSLRRRDETNQVKICKTLAPQDDFGVLTRARCEWRALPNCSTLSDVQPLALVRYLWRVRAPPCPREGLCPPENDRGISCLDGLFSARASGHRALRLTRERSQERSSW